MPPAYITNICTHVSGFTLVQMRQNLLLRYKCKTQNVIDELVKYPLSTLSCSQKGTFLSSRILEVFFLRLRVLAGSIFGLIKGPQICSDVHKSRSPYRHRGEGDAESSEKSVEANVFSPSLGSRFAQGVQSESIMPILQRQALPSQKAREFGKQE